MGEERKGKKARRRAAAPHLHTLRVRSFEEFFEIDARREGSDQGIVAFVRHLDMGGWDGYCVYVHGMGKTDRPSQMCLWSPR